MHSNFISWVLLTSIQVVIAAIVDVFRKRGLFRSKRAILTALMGLELLVTVPLVGAVETIRANPSDLFPAAWSAISLVCAFAGSLVLVDSLSLKSK